MAEEITTKTTRFPWVYAVATLLPLMFIAGVYGSTAFLDPRQSMGPAMICSLLIGPSGVAVAGWGDIGSGGATGGSIPRCGGWWRYPCWSGW